MTQNYSTARLQAQIDNTIGVARENINNVAERGVRLSALEDKTSDLEDSAQLFRHGAHQKRKEMWWEEMKFKLCLFAFAVTVIITLVVIVIIEVRKNTRA